MSLPGDQLRIEVVPLPTDAREDDELNASLAHGRLSTDAMVRLCDRYALDAVLVGSVTAWRPYTPPHLGMRTQLVSVHSGAPIWAILGAPVLVLMLMDSGTGLILILTALLAVTLVAGVPIAFAMGIVAVTGLALSGLGFGMYFAVDLALVADVLPDKDSAAKDLGVFNIAAALPSSIAPAVTPAILSIGGGTPRLVYQHAGG